MSKCWYCNNELTSGDSPKHFGICNKCYDEMFKSSDTIISSFTNKISDLEAKLAESEKKYTELFCRNIELETLYSQKTALLNFYKDTDLFKENQQLQKQLEEKEKEIKNLKDNWNLICDYLGDCVVKYDDEDVNGIYSEILSKVNEIRKYDYKYNQDKISFAVEQLKKVKKDIDCYMAIREGDLPSNIECLLLDFADKIDDQINGLKEGK